MPIEKLIVKKTILGGNKRHYYSGKSLFPPFEKEIIDMVESHPKFFTIVETKQSKKEVVTPMGKKSPGRPKKNQDKKDEGIDDI